MQFDFADRQYKLPMALPKIPVLHTILVLYILLSPLYVFRSGLPQPADLIMVLGVGTMILMSIQKPFQSMTLPFLLGWAFVIYAALINLMNFAFASDPRLAFAILFYTYNFFVLCFTVFTFQQSPLKTKQIMRLALYAVIVFELLFILFLDSSTGRATGTFNNPNQLAYWCLLNAAMIILLRKNEKLSLPDLISILIIAYIQSQSLSKAGLITFGLLMVSLPFTGMIDRRIKYGILGVVVILIGSIVFNPAKVARYVESIAVLDQVIDRLENIGHEQDDSLEGRGYDRLWNFPEYLILGAGEGAHYRFHPTGRNQELHSGLATILFSYGIPGALLFTAFVFSVFHRRPIYFLALLGVVVLFGVTHQNIRFTHFWMFLAIIYAYPLYNGQPEGRAI